MAKKSSAPGVGRKEPARSAGILLVRQDASGPRVLLAHPGGPYFANKDIGAWTIPKGLVDRDEPLADAAFREFAEELGWRPSGALTPLGEVTLRSGKIVAGFAILSTDDEQAILARFNPGMFIMPWPPHSGRTAEFPEIDRIGFFSLDDARNKLNPAQVAFLDRLASVGLESSS